MLKKIYKSNGVKLRAINDENLALKCQVSSPYVYERILSYVEIPSIPMWQALGAAVVQRVKNDVYSHAHKTAIKHMTQDEWEQFKERKNANAHTV